MTTRFAPPLTRLIEELRKLPGVGTKTAQRYAFHILRSADTDAEALSDAIRALKAALHLCSVCNNITDVDPCSYCTSPTRDQRLICVLEEPTNIAAIEKTRSYNGVYHVLHGTLSPVNGIGPDQLRLGNLWPRLTALVASASDDSQPAAELILATSPTVEGEATARYIADEAHKRVPTVRITRIATGVPAGSDIEYADEVTMTRALENRRVL
ncbi:DNA replication and repair protein RecR [Bryocella elongata]|uniref:Recombination protein RecR n=1 Tax=Bryocella elongata TaxID=863522 RepID=A0A1H5ZH38_9BACT|nr:recombination mediator RecR [Bryocella elongata]SEG35420.1 DNA replication and repair protein RecR [Bryocella elongata]